MKNALASLLRGRVLRWIILFIRRTSISMRSTRRALFPDPHVKQFIQHNKRKYKNAFASRADSIVLVGCCQYHPRIYVYSIIAPFLARRTGSRLESYGFGGEKFMEAAQIYESFGVRKGLTLKDIAAFDKRAGRLADEIFSALRTKQDVRDLLIEGVLVGDLIYDSYLRQMIAATIELTDPKLREIIFDAARHYFAVEAYLKCNKVAAVIAHHTGYPKHGILIRMALRANIPVYVTPYMRRQTGRQLFYLVRLDPVLAVGMRTETKKRSYYRYRDIFARLSPQQQDEGRRKAAAKLKEHLSGAIEGSVLDQRSAYATPGGERILRRTPKPKVLILLHDYCDGVHVFRNMLFPDFYEWSNFLCARASQTEFEWYAKPHPNSLTAEAKNVLNRNVEAELAQRYPRITFLDSSVSNLQLVQEGICAAFTVHGTAGHELAYLGIPVVNAGDNLHVAYDFNINAKTIENYVKYIDNASCLKHSSDPRQVEEFYYMHYIYFNEEKAARVEPIDAELHSDPDFLKRGRRPRIYGSLVDGETPEKERAVAEYLEGYFADSKNE